MTPDTTNALPDFNKIRYAVADAVAFITLNRPKVHNALDPQVYAELTQARTMALADPGGELNSPGGRGPVVLLRLGLEPVGGRAGADPVGALARLAG